MEAKLVRVRTTYRRDSGAWCFEDCVEYRNWACGCNKTGSWKDILKTNISVLKASTQPTPPAIRPYGGRWRYYQWYFLRVGPVRLDGPDYSQLNTCKLFATPAGIFLILRHRGSRKYAAGDLFLKSAAGKQYFPVRKEGLYRFCGDCVFYCPFRIGPVTMTAYRNVLDNSLGKTRESYVQARLERIEQLPRSTCRGWSSS